MKKMTALFLSTMILISIVGCSTSSSTESTTEKKSSYQKLVFISELPTLVTAEPTETPIAEPTAAEATSTATNIPDVATTSATLLSSPSDTYIFKNLNFGDSVATVKLHEGLDATIIDDGSGDTLTYQNVSAFDFSQGTLRYGFSSLGKLNRIQFASRLTASPSSDTSIISSIEQIVNQLDATYGQADVAVLSHTWILPDSDRSVLVSSSLAKSSQMTDIDSNNPLLVWHNAQITTSVATAADTATVETAIPSPSFLPATTLAPSNLLSSEPVISSTTTPTATATAIPTMEPIQTVDSSTNLLTYLADQKEDETVLQKALQEGAYLDYVWKNENANIVLSIRNEGTTENALYALVTIRPTNQALSETLEIVTSTDANNLSPAQIEVLLANASTLYSNAELNALFDNNGLAAEVQLQDKGVIISGEIASIDRNEFGQPTITFISAGIQSRIPVFIFDETEVTSLLSLKKGDSVKIAGIYEFHTADNIAFVHCQLQS